MYVTQQVSQVFKEYLSFEVGLTYGNLNILVATSHTTSLWVGPDITASTVPVPSSEVVYFFLAMLHGKANKK